MKVSRGKRTLRHSSQCAEWPTFSSTLSSSPISSCLCATSRSTQLAWVIIVRKTRSWCLRYLRPTLCGMTLTFMAVALIDSSFMQSLGARLMGLSLILISLKLRLTLSLRSTRLSQRWATSKPSASTRLTQRRRLMKARPPYFKKIEKYSLLYKFK